MSISHNMDKAKELKSNPFKIQNKMEKEQDIIQKMIDTVTKKEEASNVIEVLNQDFEGLLLKTKDPIQAWIRGTILKKLQFNNAGDLFLAKAAELGYVVESVSINESVDFSVAKCYITDTTENDTKNLLDYLNVHNMEYQYLKDVFIFKDENIYNEAFKVPSHCKGGFLGTSIKNENILPDTNLMENNTIFNKVVAKYTLSDVLKSQLSNVVKNYDTDKEETIKAIAAITSDSEDNIKTLINENVNVQNNEIFDYFLTNIDPRSYDNFENYLKECQEICMSIFGTMPDDFQKFCQETFNTSNTTESVIKFSTGDDNNVKTFIDKNGKNPKINDFIKDEDNNIGKIKSFFKDSSNEQRMLVDFNSHTLELNINSKFEIINPDEKLKKIFDNFDNGEYEPPVQVKFYIDTDGQPLAVFPNIIADNQGNITCYAHVGQHSSCNPEYLKELTKASKEEYNELANELISIGYNLNIINELSTTESVITEAVGYLQDTYSSIDEFLDYNEKFGIAKRLGFETPQECWSANPYYYSSTNPEDMKIVEPTTTLENFKQQFMYNPNEVNPVKEQDENAIVEKPLDYNPRALKYMINDDTFLKFSYHNLGTNEEATDLDLIYNTYIKGDDAMLAKLKTYESYTASLKESVIESNPGFKRIF